MPSPAEWLVVVMKDLTSSHGILEKFITPLQSLRFKLRPEVVDFL